MTDQALVELLFTPATALIVLSIREGRVSRCSEAARDLLHAEPNQPLDTLFDGRSRAKLVVALGAAPSSCELQAHAGDNEPVTIQISIVPWPNDEYLAFVTHVGIAYGERLSRQLLAANDHLANLTRDLARQSAELDTARRRFESLAELREQFISMLAHDVRGALTSVLLGTDAIARAIPGSTTTTESRALERIGRSSRRVLELVDKVLEIARTESGRIQLDLRPVSLRTLAREVVEIYEPIAGRDGLRLELDDLGGGDVVTGDRVRLGQVLGNVVENALRHSPRGGMVTIELGGRAGVARVVVRDEGEGIPPELRERIFERFVQGAKSSGSLGLGLYIARQVIEQHHGRIFVDDNPRRGTALAIELPLAPAS